MCSTGRRSSINLSNYWGPFCLSVVIWNARDYFLPGTDANISGLAFQDGVHSPTVDVVLACRARSAPGDRRSALAARAGRTLLRLASASAEIKPVPLTSFAYV